MKNIKIKVLNLEGWMKKYPEGFSQDNFTEIQPYFNRDGYYLINDVCWFEHNGRAWFTDPGDFKYGLMLLDVPYYRDCELFAFRILAKARLLSLDKKRMIWLHDQRSNHRENSFSRRLRIKKLIKNRSTI